MSIFKQLDRLERMDQLIRLKATGTPQAFAKRLGISESQLYRALADMRELGAPIRYCRNRQSYFYQESVRFFFGFFAESLPEWKLKKLTGGLFQGKKFLSHKMRVA